mgnify:CR=1 FL=1
MTVFALARAQVQDIVRNPMLLFFFATAVVMGGLLKATMPASARDIMASAVFTATAYFVGWNIPAFTLAEEKEKRQLEALFLTPVRPWQVILVKGVLGLVGSLVFGAFMFLILDQVPRRPLLWLTAYTVLSLFTVGLGVLLGLLVRDTRSLGLGGTPVILLLMTATTLPWALVQPRVWALQAWLPTRPAVELLTAGLTGEAVPVMRNLLVMLAYTALMWLVNARLIRRLSFARN